MRSASRASSRATSGRRNALATKPPRLAAMAADHDVVAHRHGAEQREILKGAADAERAMRWRGSCSKFHAVEHDACRRPADRGGSGN